MATKSARNILILVALCCIGLVQCEDQGDWVDPFHLVQFAVKPFFAGYLHIQTNKDYYYVYYPSESNPSKDPLLVRISAGPACSSLYSFFYSKGPFIFTPYTDTFRHNPNNWNKNANILFIEGPAGVGFSKNTSPTNETQVMDDQKFAFENIRALFSFYDKFPQLKDQDMYLSGQQYAGITVPLMAKLIIQHNNDPLVPSWTRINLKGFLLQNPCTLHDECDSHFDYTPYTMQYLMHHYYISKEKYEQYRVRCAISKISEGCKQIIAQIQQHFVTIHADINNIYKECKKIIGPEKYKCMDTAGIFHFMNNEQVRKDLHADPSIQQWDLCNLNLMQSFIRSAEGSLPIYEKLLTEQRNLRIWIISGSLSASVPLLGTRKWMQQLKLKLGLPTLRMWQSWQFDQNINAGEIQEIRGITFASVRSAGASIYLDQPEIGYHIIDSFLKGNSL